MNRHLLFLIAAIAICTEGPAQKTIDGMIQAEKNFAAWSVDHGTKDAFLQFIDVEGILFDKGIAVNGKELWNSREKRPGVLNWKPDLAEISSSGDFGYTTGPWTFRQKPGDTISGRGRFVTVWHINPEGDWKFLLDLGVSNNPDTVYKGIRKITNHPVRNRIIQDELELMLQRENRLITSGYSNLLSGKSVLVRNGRPLLVNSAEKKAALETLPEIEYEMKGSGISPGRDLGYVYGNTTINGNTDNYLRIWRKEGGEWKLALEVLRF